ncbi:MAG: TetR/AcrR family transcriptional regulator, partial [Propionicimonas sp.]|nr:TetR/AcrR family transcriptional regulator [Propionicimonas sp.]
MVTPRERARERTMAEIRELAWQQLERLGAAGLSLRAIARDLGVVSSAIYRYVASRDDLITDLLLEGFNDLAEAVAAAEGEVPREDYRERWLAICRTMRSWAFSRPAAWGLLYGGPVPGYSAPTETTSPAAARVLLRQAAVIVAAQQAGQLHPRVGPAAGLGEIPDEARPALEAIAVRYAVDITPDVTALGLLGWWGVLGTISAEAFLQLGPDWAPTQAALAEAQFASLADAVG